jgi:hypothetical protein
MSTAHTLSSFPFFLYGKSILLSTSTLPCPIWYNLAHRALFEMTWCQLQTGQFVLSLVSTGLHHGKCIPQLPNASSYKLQECEISCISDLSKEEKTDMAADIQICCWVTNGYGLSRRWCACVPFYVGRIGPWIPSHHQTLPDISQSSF